MPALPLIAVVFQLVEGAGVVAALLNNPSLHFLKLLLLEGQLSQLAVQGTAHCRGEEQKVWDITQHQPWLLSPADTP